MDDTSRTAVGTAYVDRDGDGSCESPGKGEILPFIWTAGKGMRALDTKSLPMDEHVIVGNYGSGKSEVAINLALHHRQSGAAVRIADLDMVNPYFRSREAAAVLAQRGIEVVLPPSEYLRSELPVLSPLVAGIIRRPGALTLLD